MFRLYVPGWQKNNRDHDLSVGSVKDLVFTAVFSNLICLLFIMSTLGLLLLMCVQMFFFSLQAMSLGSRVENSVLERIAEISSSSQCVFMSKIKFVFFKLLCGVCERGFSQGSAASSHSPVQQAQTRTEFIVTFVYFAFHLFLYWTTLVKNT